MTILLIGANERAAYSLAKTYCKKGYGVTVLNDVPHPLRHSRFVRHFIVIPYSFTKQTNTAAQAIVDVLKTNKFDIAIPIHDATLSICFYFQQQFSNFTKLLFVNEAASHVFCQDKAALLKRCEQLNIPVPKSILIKTLEDLDNIATIRFPCIAKPVSSKVYSNGKIFSYTVKKINTKEELLDFIREKIETVTVMVQEILEEGYGVGYNFLSMHGKVLNAYAHQRINEAWGGGQSTYRKTIDPIQYNLEAYSKKLIESIGWTGIAMIEYRIVNDKAYIMEINGRSWGSIELGIFAGCDLPEDMITAIYKNEPVEQYVFTNPVYARNLLNELIWVAQSKSPKIFLKWCWNLKNSFQKDQGIEDNPFVDFYFRLAFATYTIVEQVQKLAGKMRQKFLLPPIKVVKKTDISTNKNIAFICKGNINRSAFAEYYIKKTAKNYAVSSYGTVFEENRLSPINAVETAAHFGIDLNLHRSKYLTPEAIEKTDIFIIMDKINFTDLRSLNIPVQKIFLLNKNGIADPYAKGNAFFKKTFTEIIDSLKASFG